VGLGQVHSDLRGGGGRSSSGGVALG
jgi:hypothetical protein